MTQDEAENAPGSRELKDVERLIEDAQHEGATAEEALRKEAEDLAKAERKLEELRHSEVTIIVDGTPHKVPRREHITYVEVVTLAHPDYPKHPEITYSVTYTRGPDHKPEGILPPGGSVKVKEGMSFVVNRTGQS
jgi:hypothetical protein